MAKKSLSRLIQIVTGTHGDGEREFNRLERFVHFWTLVGKSFVRNRCPVRAAALSYASLLALIPLLAVAISVTSIFLKNEGEQKIYQAVDRLVSSVMPPARLNTNDATLNLSPNMSIALSPTNTATGTNSIASAADTRRVETAQKQAAQKIHEFIQKTRSGTLGSIGMLLLIYVAIRMLASIEATFNDIWGVTRGRNWLIRIVLYWTTITLGPLLIVGALGLTSGAHFQSTRHLVEKTPVIGGMIFQFLPLMVLWLTFALVYQLVPNTKVKFSAALIGGIVGGSLWHLNNLFGFLYASRVVSYSKVYGSLGLVPVFMVGLYFSWLILLFGSQVAYAFQNRASYLQEKLVENVNQRGKEFLALRLMTLIGQRFQSGEPAVTVQQISAEFGIPTRLVQQVLQTLLAARLVAEIAGPEISYTPARPLEDINAHHILRAMRTGQGQEAVTRDEPVRSEVLGEFARIEEAERDAASRITLRTLVLGAQKQLQEASETNEPKRSK